MPKARGRPWKIRETYDCDTCGARKGQLCRNKHGIPSYAITHVDRLQKYHRAKMAGEINW